MNQVEMKMKRRVSSWLAVDALFCLYHQRGAIPWLVWVAKQMQVVD